MLNLILPEDAPFLGVVEVEGRAYAVVEAGSTLSDTADVPVVVLHRTRKRADEKRAITQAAEIAYLRQVISRERQNSQSLFSALKAAKTQVQVLEDVISGM